MEDRKDEGEDEGEDEGGKEHRVVQQATERRGFGGPWFLLEAHLEKATRRRTNKKVKNARKPSGEGENRSRLGARC